LLSVTLKDLAVDISTVEVVPFLLVLRLPQEHAEMGKTSTAGNSQHHSSLKTYIKPERNGTLLCSVTLKK